MKEKLVEVGAVRKTHGYRGELKLTVYEGFEDDVEAADFFFIGSTPERALPYEVDEIRGADWIVRLGDLGDKEAAAALRGQALYLRADGVTSARYLEEQSRNEQFGKYVGYGMIDLRLGLLGTISEVLQYPQQVLAAVEYLGAEKLIPLNEAFVTSIDELRKEITVDLPEGLLEL